eukprot:CAMPEP_0181113018 /NCGR_PEP_ID=MMETSP1071-20121207/20119_1 /TAXON_ID=35127 /ORGANISM="Thalassiosira sp., Strain NH16" /LENGTH=582 /DNA_ID=CAMNT_0023197019 /DNA_START=52 /DNA_END=1800 /DNA_ORIENTATION=+
MSDNEAKKEDVPAAAATDEPPKDTAAAAAAMTDDDKNKDAPAAAAAATATDTTADASATTDATAPAPTDGDAAPSPAEEEAPLSEEQLKIVADLTERLRFFFSNANLRGDRWMRDRLSERGCIPLDALMRFNTLKAITGDGKLLARAAMSEELKGLIVYDAKKEEVRRAVPFDWRTMGDGSHLSLLVKNVPLTKKEEESPPAVKKEEVEEGKKGDDDAAKEKESEDKKESKDNNAKSSRARYAVTRTDIQSLFEPYGRVGIVRLRYGRGSRPGQSYPMGLAVVEFETKESLEKACADLLPPEKDAGDAKKEEEDGKKDEKEVANDDDKMKVDDETKIKEEGDGETNIKKEESDDENKNGPKKVLEINGHKLVIERERPSKIFQKMQRDNNGKKRSRDGEDSRDDNKDQGSDVKEEEIKFEPITMEWEKGCVISLAGLSSESCDRESIRDAVSSILDVSTDVKTSGLYVDYNRGESAGKLRLKVPKPDHMKELVEKLNGGDILIANSKVESAKILEGEEEEEYWKEFVAWMNRRKRMREEEKRRNSNMNNKRQKFGGGRSGGGRGRGRGSYMGGRGRGGRGRR